MLSSGFPPGWRSVSDTNSVGENNHKHKKNTTARTPGAVVDEQQRVRDAAIRVVVAVAKGNEPRVELGQVLGDLGLQCEIF